MAVVVTDLIVKVPNVAEFYAYVVNDAGVS